MEVSYYVAVTLDGFIAEADGSVGFLEQLGEPDPNGYEAFFNSIDGLLMGRATYDQILTFGDWPYGDKPCWVATGRELESGTRGKALSGTPQELVDSIQPNGIQRLWLVGGSRLAGQFANAQLIDKLIASVVPVCIGSGNPLFQSLQTSHWFGLEQTFQRNHGVMELHFKAKHK